MEESSSLFEWEVAINVLLDTLHDSATRSNFKKYFECFSENGCFIGTDSNEYWNIQEFKEFCRPHFQNKSAWTYTPIPGKRILIPCHLSLPSFTENSTLTTSSSSTTTSTLPQPPITASTTTTESLITPPAPPATITTVTTTSNNENVNSSLPSFVSFDEQLIFKSLNCNTRGSGTIVYNSEKNQWEILSYYLSFPIPNSIGGTVAKLISDYHSTHIDPEKMKKLEADAELATNALFAELDQEEKIKKSKKSKSQKKKNKSKGKH